MYIKDTITKENKKQHDKEYLLKKPECETTKKG